MKILAKNKINKRPYDENLKQQVLSAHAKLSAADTIDIDFEAIRYDVELTTKELPDGWIHQIFLDEGYEVIP